MEEEATAASVAESDASGVGIDATLDGAVDVAVDEDDPAVEDSGDDADMTGTAEGGLDDEDDDDEDGIMDGTDVDEAGADGPVRYCG